MAEIRTSYALHFVQEVFQRRHNGNQGSEATGGKRKTKPGHRAANRRQHACCFKILN